MIQPISLSHIKFAGSNSGKSTRDAEFGDDFGSQNGQSIEEIFNKNESPQPENYRAYLNIPKTSNIRLEKKIFGYGTENSLAVKPYLGDMTKTAGFSTEGDESGGGWIKASLDTPLSTADIHTCAVVNLVNEKTNEQFLYHVYRGVTNGTSTIEIEKFLLKEFPDFNKVNIIAGDQQQTNVAVNCALTALNDINKSAKVNFYHFSSENPEIVAQNGDLSFIERDDKKMTFTEVKNNFS